MRFYIETFGCTANSGNSQDASAALIELGHIPSTLDEADAVIVNTCAVTAKTERKILRRIKELQGERLVICGCIPAALPSFFRGIPCKKQMGILGREAALQIASLFSQSGQFQLDQTHSGPKNSAASSPQIASRPALILSAGNFPVQEYAGIINIAEGCCGSCTYCIVRQARGRLVSKSSSNILEEARRLIGMGVAEIRLAAQDTASYGADRGCRLPELLDRLASLPGDFMIRVGMMNPDSLKMQLAEMILALKSPKVFRFLHIPLQSGSDDVLKSMGRRYTAQDFVDIVQELRSSLPDICINTDIICGFPGETEDDFLKTLNTVRQVAPDKVNVTRFSSRPGTPAARLYDMPDRIKKDRSRHITALWLEIAGRRNRDYEGRALKALVTEQGRSGTIKARAANYAGLVIPGAPDLCGWCKIRVVGSNPFYLEGVLEP